MLTRKSSWIEELISATSPSNFFASASLVKKRLIAPALLIFRARSSILAHVLRGTELAVV